MTDSANTYSDTVVRQFSIMTIVWGIVGMLAGVWIAAQLIWPVLNFDVPWLSYGRLRPLHTNAVIFAFGGSALFATSSRAENVSSEAVSTVACELHVLGVAADPIVLAAITLPLGLTQAKSTPSSSGRSTC